MLLTWLWLSRLRLLLCLLLRLLLPPQLLSFRPPGLHLGGLLLLLRHRRRLLCLLLRLLLRLLGTPLLLLRLLAGRLFKADLRLLLSLLNLNPRLSHLLNLHLGLRSGLDSRLDLLGRRLHQYLRLDPLDLHLRLLLRRSHSNTSLRHIHADLRLRHLYADLRLRHMHRDLWLGLLDGYGRRGHAYGDLRLWLPYGHLWLGLLNRDPRCCWRDLYLR